MAATARSAPRRYRRSWPRRRDRARAAAPGWPVMSPRQRSRLASARTIDQRSRAVAGQDVDQHDFAAMGFDDLAANDLLAGVVAALDQHARLHLRDQIDR